MSKDELTGSVATIEKGFHRSGSCGGELSLGASLGASFRLTGCTGRTRAFGGMNGALPGILLPLGRGGKATEGIKSGPPAPLPIRSHSKRHSVASPLPNQRSPSYSSPWYLTHLPAAMSSIRIPSCPSLSSPYRLRPSSSHHRPINAHTA